MFFGGTIENYIKKTNRSDFLLKKKNYYIFAIMLVTVIFGGIAGCSLFAKFVTKANSTISIDQFLDVKKSDWFYDDVNYALQNGLMNGTASDLFSPNETIKRGMLVAILWRLDENPSEKRADFLDVQKDAYYFHAVNWAYANGIVNGYDEKSFGPEDDITREQLATIIYKYAVYKKYDVSGKTSLNRYEDANLISDYAIPALKWANANEIITGTPKNQILPQGSALRCEVVAILRRFCSQIVSADEKTIVKPESNSAYHSIFPNEGIVVDDTNERTDEIVNDSAVITLNSVTAAPGNYAQISVNIENNPGILGMTLTLHYDESNISLESVENGDAFQDVLTLTTSKSLKSGTRFAWDGLEISPEDIKDGTVLCMNFCVLDNAKAGKHPITLTYTEVDIVDNNLKSIFLPVANGYITVTE